MLEFLYRVVHQIRSEKKNTSESRQTKTGVVTFERALLRHGERENYDKKSFGDGVNKSARKDVDAMEEEKARSERLVGRDCEQRRYLFRAHFAEIESNRREVFV